jgi:hypothetical protein
LSANEIAFAVLALAGIASTMIICVIWLIKSLLRSKSGKIIDAVKASKKQLIIAATPGHLAHLFKVSQFVPGVLQTAKFSDRVGKKRKVFYEPEKTEVFISPSEITGSNLTDEEKQRSAELTQECLNHMLRSNTEKLYLEDGVPVTLAIEDKVITTGVKGIGALAYYEKLCKISQLKGKIAALKQSQFFGEVGVYLEGLASQVSFISIDVLRNYFDSDYDQTDDEAQKELHYMMGYRDGQKKEKGIEKFFVIGGIGLAIAGIVGGAVLAYIGKG